MSSIIEESKQARKGGILGMFKNKKIIISGIVLLVIFACLFYIVNRNNPKVTEAQKKEWTVKRDDIRIAIETDGKVVAEDGVELSFSVSGDNLEVENVFVKEGDKIKKGDKVATVKTEILEFNVRNVYSNYLSALADYNDAIAGATDKQIADAKDKISSAEISLEQAEISLENTRQSAAESIQAGEDSIYDAERALADAKDDLTDNENELSSEDVNDAYESLVDTIKSTNISLDSILKDSDKIIGVDEESLNDDFEDLLGAKDAYSLNQAKNSYKKAKSEFEKLDSLVVPLNISSPYGEIDVVVQQMVLTLHEFEEHLYSMKLMLEATVTSSDFLQTELNSLMSTINSNRATVNTKITAINTKTEDVDDAMDGLDDYVTDYEDAKKDLNEAERDLVNTKVEVGRNIKNSEASLNSKKLSLEQVQRDYEDLIAPMTEAELASAQSKLTSSSISLEKAQYELEKATIISPIDGEVAMLSYKAGDIIIDNSSSDPVAVIINNNTLFIEVNIEEADINKIKAGQKAYATFDALDELKLEGEISFISLTSKTDNNSIVTYLVRVIFENTEEAQIREGMTAFVDFIITETNDVLTIPVESVRNISGQPSVEANSGEWKAVTTGFTDGKYVEVLSGLNAGDTVLY